MDSRQEALRRFELLDSAPEPSLERLAALAALAFDAPRSGVCLFGARRPWLQSPLEGPPGVVIPDAHADARFRDHPAVAGTPHLRFYASAPLCVPGGELLGALWVADVRPRAPTSAQLEALGALAAQVMDALELRARTRELEAERRRLEAAVSEAARIQAELVRARDQLAALVTIDELTGIDNRRSLNQRLALLVAEAARGRRFGVVMVDLDHFKQLNDTRGHAEGDRVLRAVAQQLKAQLRKTDFVARAGGEEFCVLLTDVDAPRAVLLAERLRAAVAALPGGVTASFGVAVCTSPQQAHAERLLHAADQALYRAKRAGRDHVVLARHDSKRRLADAAA
jgi:diguanylate cyclase (GGDEF)-like protein